MRYLFVFIFLLTFISINAQKNNISLEDNLDHYHNSSLDQPKELIWVLDSTYRTILTDNVWHLTSRTINAQRNADRQITEILYDSKNKETGIWEKVNRTTQYYNEFQTKDSSYLYVWSTSQDSFRIYSKNLYENDINGLTLSYTRYRWKTNTSSWNPDKKFTYTYESNRIKNLLVENYDKNLMEWSSYYLNKYSYNDENLNDSTLVCIWNEDHWNLGRFYVHDYLNNSSQLATTTIWIENDIDFIRSEQIVYNYDENNNRSIVDNYVWKEDLGLWIQNIFSNYFWSPIEINASESIKQPIPFNISPNPVSDQLYIDNEIWNHNAVLQIYNIDGQHFLSMKYDSPTIDISNLRSGIYILNIINTNNLYTSKMIIE